MLILIGGEQFHNIYINDLRDEGLKLVNYLGNDPLYIINKLDENLNAGEYNMSWTRNPSNHALSYCPYWT
jgi:hypothetical protein